MRKSRSILILTVLLAAAGVAYAYYPPFRLLTWVAAGRSPDCPLAQALQSERNAQKEQQYNERIAKESKLVSVDAGGLELWATPKGRFWVPRGNRNLLPFHLAAQERGIYSAGDTGPRAGDIAIDWGASIGVTVTDELLAGAEKVIAVEPASDNLECLRRNLSNEIATGRVVLYERDPSTTVDKLVANLNLARVDTIRFDLDGDEPKTLGGARDTVARFKPRISVTAYRRSDHPKLVEQIMHGLRPDYLVRCGPCAPIREAYSIRPDVLYFQ